MFCDGVGMNTLKELDLSRCSKISDAGIKHIVTIESLEKLHLSETGLTDNGVMAISSLKNLCFLDLGGIHMTDKALQYLQVCSLIVGIGRFLLLHWDVIAMCCKHYAPNILRLHCILESFK